MNINNQKMQRAYNVLYLLQSNFLFDEKLNCDIGAYDNCREQGLSLLFWFIGKKLELTFLIAENRNSDEMVIYWQKKSFNRAFSDECMTKQMYKNREYFKNEFETAKRINEIIKKELYKC